MALVLLDRAKETTTVVGTGTATLLGAVTSYQSLAGVGNGNTTYYCIVDQVGANWEVGIGTYTSAGTTLARTTVLASSNAGALVVFTTGVKDVFVTYPSEKGVWYDASGNVLFTGTTTAANLAYTGTLTGSTGILNIGSGQLYKDASGNVGIGTSTLSSATKLEVYGNSAAAHVGVRVNNTANDGYASLWLSSSASNDGIIRGGSTAAAFTNQLAMVTSSAIPITFNTNNAERMRIDSSGNVGIGTSSPSGKLTVAGAITNNVASGISFTSISSTTTMVMGNVSGVPYLQAYNSTGANSGMAFYNYSSEAMRIDSSGNLLVGTTTVSAVGSRLSIKGSAVVWGCGPTSGNDSFFVYNASNVGVYLGNGGTSWSSSSDERLKTDLIPIENGLDKVISLRSVTGRFKTDEVGTSRSFLIAQDVQVVLPEAVSVQDDELGTLGVAYTEVIPLLVASIKELKAIIDTQQEQINSLLGK